MKKTLSLLLSCILFLNFVIPVIADEAARTIVIFEIEGSGAKMTKGAEKEFTAKAGQKLFEGYTVSTGTDSSVYLKLDESSLVKIDPKSKISISRASSKKLSVTVLSGAITVNAQKQKEGEEMEIRVGNSALAIRGTIFTVEQTRNSDVTITMIKGSGSVDGHLLLEGNIMDISDDKEKLDKKHVIRMSEVDKDTSPVVLRAILENWEELAPHFSEEKKADIEVWLDEKENEAKESEDHQPDNNSDENKNTTYYREESPEEDITEDLTYDDAITGEIVAFIGTTGYASVLGALEAAVPGDNVRVMSSTVLSMPLSINSDITLTVESPAILAISADLIINGTLNIAKGATLNNMNNSVITNNSNTINTNGKFYNYGILKNTPSGKIVIGSDGMFNLGGTGGLQNNGELILNGGFTGSTGGRIETGTSGSFSGTNLSALTGLGYEFNFGMFTSYQINSNGLFQMLLIKNDTSGKYYATINEAVADWASGDSRIVVTGNFTQNNNDNITISQDVIIYLPNLTSMRILGSTGFTNNGTIQLAEDSYFELNTSSTGVNNGSISLEKATAVFRDSFINNGSIAADSNHDHCGDISFESGLVNYGVIYLKRSALEISGVASVSASGSNISLVNGDFATQKRGEITLHTGGFTSGNIDHQYGFMSLSYLSTTISGAIVNGGPMRGSDGPYIEIMDSSYINLSGTNIFTYTWSGRLPMIMSNCRYYSVDDVAYPDPIWYDVLLGPPPVIVP